RDHRAIEFCHPGYDYPHNILFRLSAIEPDAAAPTPTKRFGVHHDTARIACAILANNAWDGYLTANEADGPRVSDNPECILVNSRYYFHHPAYQSDLKYPIVADFESWQFPDTLPSYWRSFTIPPSRSTQPLPRRCVVTGRQMALEAAHLIPLAQSLWFDRNSMDRFQNQVGQDNINWVNQPFNKFQMTKDIHSIADQGHLVFVPHSTYTSIQVALVSYVLKPDAGHELLDLYHLRSLEPLQGVTPEYIFANFAHAIFHICTFFKYDGWQRRCIQLDMEAVPIQYITKGNPTSPDHQFRKPSRSFTKRRTTSQSSQGSKRTRSSSNQERGSSSSEQDDGGWASTYGETDTADDEDTPRGRSLKR
ncbi:hypothetical protein F5883DRAFT_378224, partial [Diaporthe sp. PMI_573]